MTPEQLTGYETVTAAGDATKRALQGMPAGGLCYFSQNITGSDQLRARTSHGLEPAPPDARGGWPMVMVGHVKTPNAAADDLPASLSPFMIGKTLRDELGFDGVIISDSFSMGAVTQHFGPADVAVRFLAAGGDMVLMPENLSDAYRGVLDAVSGGTLSSDRVDESCLRILKAKQAAGLLG